MVPIIFLLAVEESHGSDLVQPVLSTVTFRDENIVTTESTSVNSSHLNVLQGQIPAGCIRSAALSGHGMKTLTF